MKTTSKITGKTYEPEDVRWIPNVRQSMKLLEHHCDEYLVDIICGKDEKLVFVWLKELYEGDTKMDDMYRKWCNREL